MHIPLLIIWLIFTIIFFALCKVHWNDSKKQIERLSEPQKFFSDNSSGNFLKIRNINIDEPLGNFVKDLNNYIDARNEESKKTNKRAALGYLAAFCTAIISAFLELLKVLNNP